MEVRIAFLKDYAQYKRGEIALVPVSRVHEYLSDGKAVYYADFTSSMLEEKAEEPKKKPSKKG